MIKMKNVMEIIHTYLRNSGSSRSKMFFEIGALKNFTIFTKTPMPGSLFDKIACLKACNLIVY